MQKKYFGYSENELLERGAIYTAKEIYHQPEVWVEVYNSIYNKLDEILEFKKQTFENLYEIILLGAGSSAFIGETLESIVQTETKIATKSIPTTSFITHPENYLLKDKKYLLISFARSGDSPESVAAIQLANMINEKINHLIITCNSNGALAKMKYNSTSYVLILPPSTNDRSLAMTSSFTSMLLACILFSKIENLKNIKNQVELLGKYANKILNEYFGMISTVANQDFDRAIFLGSGFFEGIARESQLKLQELTDGKIICKHDTFLGLRHGPKVVIKNHTLMVYLFSNNEYANRYEIDLVNSIEEKKLAFERICLLENDILGVEIKNKIILSDGTKKLDEEFLTIVSVLPAQLLGFLKSLNFGLKPDKPSGNGAISRVVQGVNIYTYVLEVEV
jgi:tagatose-6-phosphate ketose/aldose isomerase